MFFWGGYCSQTDSGVHWVLLQKDNGRGRRIEVVRTNDSNILVVSKKEIEKNINPTELIGIL